MILKLSAEIEEALAAQCAGDELGLKTELADNVRGVAMWSERATIAIENKLQGADGGKTLDQLAAAAWARARKTAGYAKRRGYYMGSAERNEVVCAFFGIDMGEKPAAGAKPAVQPEPLMQPAPKRKIIKLADLL